MNRSELFVMELLWNEGDMSAKDIAERLGESCGWKKTTTYTVIGKCAEKGYLERREPDYICHALISQEANRKTAAEELLDRLFEGSVENLFATMLKGRKLSQEEIDRLRKMIEEQ